VSHSSARIALWGLLAAAAMLLLAGATSVPLLDPDEARLARTAVEMMRTHDPVVPTFAGRPQPSTPPLLPWIQSSLFRTLGIGAGVARLPAVLATVATIGLVAWIARRRFGDEGALWAAAVTATTPLVAVLGPLGAQDALLALHVLAAVALDIAEPRETGAYRGLAIGCLLGLAFLIRGPVGLVLPVVILLAGRTASGRDVLPDRGSALVALAGWCGVVLPWGLAFAGRVGWEGAAASFRVGPTGAAAVPPSWEAFATAGLAWFPWIAPVAVALVRVVARRSEPASRTGAYAAAGLAAGLAFLWLGRGEVPGAFLPLAPLAAILATWELGRELDAPRERVAGPLLLSAALGAAALGLALGTVTGLDARFLGFATGASAVYGAGAVAGLAGVLARRPRWTWGAAASASAAVAILTVVLLLPELARERTAGALAETIPGLRSRPVVVVGREVPSLVFHLDRVPEVVATADLPARVGRDDDALVVVAEEDLARLDPGTRTGLREVGRRGVWVVLEPLPRGSGHGAGAAPDASEPPG